MLFLVVFILVGVSLTICGLLGFHTNFGFFFSSSVKNAIRIVIRLH